MTIDISNLSKSRGWVRGRARSASIRKRENMVTGHMAAGQMDVVSEALTMTIYQMLSNGAGKCR